MTDGLKLINTLLASTILVISMIILFYPLPYCSQENKNDCRKCPTGASCSGMKVTCPIGYSSNRKECVRDPIVQQKIEMIKIEIDELLRKRMGEFDCNNVTFNKISHPFMSRTELEHHFNIVRTDTSSDMITLIQSFSEAISSFSCYFLQPLNSSLNDSIKSILFTDFVVDSGRCGIRSAYIINEEGNEEYNPLLDEYFIVLNDPIRSCSCQFKQYINAHSDIIRYYGGLLLSSIILVLVVQNLILSVLEIGEMRSEIYNILVEKCQDTDSFMEVSQIKERIVHSGPHRILAHILWNTVAKRVENGGYVIVGGKCDRKAYVKYWKWCGNDKVIVKCSRRPHLSRSIKSDGTTQNTEFYSKFSK